MNVRDGFKDTVASIISLEPTIIDVTRTLAGNNFKEQNKVTSGKMVGSINEFRHNRVVDDYGTTGSSVWHSHVLHSIVGVFGTLYTAMDIVNILAMVNLLQSQVTPVDLATFKLEDMVRQYNAAGQIVAYYRVLSPIYNSFDGVVEVNLNLLVNAG